MNNETPLKGIWNNPEINAGQLPTVIDIEASGFGPESYPIEVGVVKSNGDRYCTLIKPTSEWKHWSLDAESLHKISPEVLLELGKPVRDVCFDLNEFLDDEDVFCDAWSHDHTWLSRLYEVANVHPSFHLRAIEFILSEDQLSIWDDTRSRVFSSHSFARHRASNDAFMIQKTYEQSLKATSSLPDTPLEIHVK